MTMYPSADSGLGNTGRRQSFVDRDSHFNGTHVTPNDFHIEGHYDGTIECAGALVVAETADVNARVTAGSISVAGHLQGEIGCRGRFEILATGRVEARVNAAAIVIHQGAQYEGEMKMGGEGSPDRESASEETEQPRSDPRPSRRPPNAAENAGVPSFSAGQGRTNGRSVPVDEPSEPASGRPSLPGQD